MTRTLRLARPADAAALAVLHPEGFDRPWTADEFSDWLGRKEAFAIFVESGAAPVAFGLALSAGDDAELLTIVTSVAARRSGVGREVFRALDVEAAGRGLRRWVLEVARNNLAALGLYRGEGFVEIGVRPNYYQQPGGRVDALLLARPVGLAGGQEPG